METSYEFLAIFQKLSITEDEDMDDNTCTKLAVNEASVNSSSESSDHTGGVCKPVTFLHRGEVHPVVYLHESLLSSHTDDIRKFFNPMILFSFPNFNSLFSFCLPFIKYFGPV